ncbi:MAG: bacillithiol biosynthesis deacetylase BshB1, partial [FCB group bacterium]|nr:bacillithiol biosynthesis deacetylase BshB1 [FCB group bacterium]
MKVDVLAIAAHPDDVEITCGGTMIKLAENGRKTGILDLTQGEMGTLGNAEDRRRESEKAAEILKVTVRENLGLPDSVFEVNQNNIEKLASVIRRFCPDIVILPHKNNQRHPDHRKTAILGYDACFLAGLAKADLEGEPHRPMKILYASSFMKVEHSFFVDISGQFERKKEAVAAYSSQFDGSEQSRQIFRPGNDIFELMEVYHRQYGIE